MTVFQDHVDLAVSLVAVAPSPGTSGLSFEVTPGEGVILPVPPFDVTFAPPDAVATFFNSEVAIVDSVVGDVCTLSTRAAYGTVARDVQVGDRAVATITANHMQTVEQAIAALEAAAGVGPWTPYVPTWTAVSALVQPDIGDGTLVGRFTQVGFTTHFEIELTVGSTTTWGNGTFLEWGLPVTAPAGWVNNGVGTWFVYSPTGYLPGGYFGSNIALSSITDVALFTGGSDFVDGPTYFDGILVPGDTIKMSGTYEAATGSGGGGSGSAVAESQFHFLDVGQEIFSRVFLADYLTNPIPLTANFGQLTYFTARKSETTTQALAILIDPSSGFTTLFKMGLYLIDSGGNGTLVAVTVDDPSLVNSGGGGTPITGPWVAPYDIVSGQRYAMCLLMVGGTQSSFAGAVRDPDDQFSLDPRMSGSLAFITDLPASFVPGDISPEGKRTYGVILP